MFVYNCLITLPKHSPFKVPVSLKNETDHDIILPRNCILAELSVPQRIISDSCKNEQELTAASCSSLQRRTFDHNLQFNFGETLLPQQWRNCITQRLNSVVISQRLFSDVISHHELDFGHATKIKHCIKLMDPTPFKQRP